MAEPNVQTQGSDRITIELPGAADRAAHLALMEGARTSDLADLVLEDIALSFELLRMVNNAQVAGDWALCRDQQLPWFRQQGERDLWRLSVPATAPALDLPEPPLVEWHGAQRWVRVEPALGLRVREAAARAGGHATLFRPGPSVLPRPPRFDALSPALDHIHRELKRQFDPAGIFNRGRLSPSF